MGKAWGDLPLDVETLLEAVDRMMGAEFADGLDRSTRAWGLELWRTGFRAGLGIKP